MKKIYATMAASSATVLILLIVRTKVSRPMLIADRFVNGSGILEAVVLAVYAGFITWKMLDPAQTAKWRLRIWSFFSVIFFLQFLLGVFMSDIFLMSGRLHVPVPAVIIAGPIYRGEGLFMPVLLLTTILLAGPAWCSYLCYIGSWDAVAATSRKSSPVTLRYKILIRSCIIFFLITAALILRLTGTKPVTAAYFAVGFGLAGVLIMIIFSRRKGLMVHCLSWCPIGLISTAIGRISPFRISFNDECSSCGACSFSCRYDALKPENIRNKKPDISCTLCGDCIASCKVKSLQYTFGPFKGEKVRIFFITLIVAIHSVFLGLARI